MTLDSPILALLCLPLLAWVLWLTRRPMKILARSCTRLAAVALCVAAAGLSLRCDRPAEIAVMVDVSPSTRGALLRDPKAVAQRLAPLLNGRPASVHYFADGLQANDAEANVSRTRLDVPTCDAVVLLSDGRFDAPPSLPPVFAVVDPSLDRSGDGRVVAIDAGTRPTVSTAVDGPSRTLTVTGARVATEKLQGQQVIALRDVQRQVTATLNSGDRWPENDSMTVPVPPATAERWSVDSPVPGTRAIAAVELPTSLAGYVGVSSIVLPTTAAIDDARAAVLRHYVEQLGGTLILSGPPAAASTTLRAIEPLSAVPPKPSGQWTILLDASGSMATAGRWPAALAAAERAIDSIGANERVSLVTFARSPQVVVDRGTPASVKTALQGLAATSPGGPTGLRAGLEAIPADETGPTRVLLVTDGDADLGDRAELVDRLKAAKVQVFALLAAPAPSMERLASDTGGAAMVKIAPADWANALEALAAGGHSVPVAVTKPIAGEGTLSGLTLRPDRRWQAWPRDSADVLARDGAGATVAQWQAGLGKVVSASAEFSAGDIAAILNRLPGAAEDPRFAISIDEAAHVVRVTASDGSTFLNGLHLSMSRGANMKPLQQTAPGHYEASLAPSPEASIAIFRRDDQIVARRAIGGRYPEEFDTIGNDRAALAAFAQRTGGRVVDAGDNRPLEIHGKVEWRSLRLVASIVGVVLGLVGLLLLRMPYLEDRVLKRLGRRQAPPDPSPYPLPQGEGEKTFTSRG